MRNPRPNTGARRDPRPATALRSGAFRFALALALIFAAGAAAVLWVVERQISRYALGATETMLHGEATVLSGEYAREGRAALLEALARHAHAGHDDQFHYLLLDAKGHALFGDLPRDAVRLGEGTLVARDDADPAARMRQLGVDLGGGLRLYIATDTFDIDLLRGQLARFTVLSGLAITLFALVGGYGVGLVFLRRLGAVNRTTERIIAGDGSERLPAIGLAPEFDALTRNLNRMLDRIAASMEGLRQVSTAIAHELRTPLMRLQQRLERLQAQGDAPAAEAEAALAEIAEILETFQALLRIGMIEGGAGRARFSAVALSELLARLVETYQPVAEDAGHALTGVIAPNITVKGDAQLLTQLFSNLVENAIVHTPEGTHTILTLAIDSAGAVVATVADDGPGLAAGDEALVFQRFYRGAESRQRPGSGLGLSLVAAIAHLHEGRCTIIPAPKGFCVAITLGPNEISSVVEVRSPILAHDP